jgi:hypothetical protein
MKADTNARLKLTQPSRKTKAPKIAGARRSLGKASAESEPSARLAPVLPDPMMAGEEIFKTRIQIAARYQVSVRTIDYWCDDASLPFYKRGGIVRFDPTECDQAMKVFHRRSRFLPREQESADETTKNGSN